MTSITFVSASHGFATGSGLPLLETTDGGSTWVEAALPSTGLTIGEQVRHLDATHVWVTVVNGWGATSVFYSKDAGAAWTTGFDAPAGWYETNAVDFISALEGWATGGDSTGARAVWHTTDGGLTWTKQTFADLGGGLAIDFFDSQHGWSVGPIDNSPCSIQHTTNGGTTWTAQAAGPAAWSGTLNDIVAASPTQAWAVGTGGRIFHTVDGGDFWGQQPVPGDGTPDLYGVSCISTTTAWAVGKNAIFKTTDAGLRWTSLSLPYTGTFVARAVTFVDATHGWIAGDGSLIACTRNGGASWQLQSAGPFVADFNAIGFAGTNNGWVSGEDTAGDPVVLHTTNGGAAWQYQTTGMACGGGGVEPLDTHTAFLFCRWGILKTTTGGVSPLDTTLPTLKVSKPSGLWFEPCREADLLCL